MKSTMHVLRVKIKREGPLRNDKKKVEVCVSTERICMPGAERDIQYGRETIIGS